MPTMPTMPATPSPPCFLPPTPCVPAHFHPSPFHPSPFPPSPCLARRRLAAPRMGLKSRLAAAVAGRFAKAVAAKRAEAKAVAAAAARKAGPPAAAAPPPPEGLMLGGMLGKYLDAAREDAGKAVERLKELSMRGDGGQAVGAALATALQAVGVGGDDADDDLEDPVGTPGEPEFDPISALILAGYAFQAYLEPARGAYWESYSAAVQGSEVSQRSEQTVTTRVAYPSTEGISKVAKGLFMVQTKSVAGEEGKALDPTFFVTALLNGTALFSDAYKDGSAVFSLLQKEAVSESAAAGAQDSVLLFSVYESESSFRSGGAVLCTASVALEKLVADAEGQLGGARGEAEVVVFRAVSEEEAGNNFFEAELLPEGMELPFKLPISFSESRDKFQKQVDGAAISVEVSYVPFHDGGGMVDGVDDEDEDEDKDEDEDEEEEEEEEETEAEAIASRDATALAVSEAMKEGNMPLQWQSLAKGLHDMVEKLEGELEKSSLTPRTEWLREDLPQHVYIESPETDSEVWIWHDKERKHVVLSFRGTEQTSWQDFVTDSLVFMQAWVPGTPINLDIKAGQTMGLDLWDVMVNGSKKGKDDDVSAMSCVHWGFLRAYLSLRGSVDHVVDSLTNGFEDGYKYYVTGHSLGGALATVCACDLQARHGGDEGKLDICMVNYGSPRVGNRSFAREFNRLVPNAFRVVNGSDLVARMPQTPSRLRGGFRHVGRTCLVDEEGSTWVQGADGSQSKPFPGPKVENLGDLLRREQEMWQLLVSGKSLGHHMEDSYFLALRSAIEKMIG